MSGVVAVTAGVVATEIGLVVSDASARRRSVHIDLTVPVVTDGLRERIEGPVVANGQQGAAGRGIVASDAVTGRTLVMEAHCSNETMIDQLTAERSHFRFGSDTVRGIAMTGGAVESEGCRFGMAVQAADADSTIQINAVTEGTGILNIARRVMEGRIRQIRAGPGYRMCVGRSVTATGLTAGTIDANIETGVAPRSARRGIGMTALAGGQIGFGIGAVVGRVEIRSIQRMRYLAGAVGMATAAVETGGKTTRRTRSANTPLQVRPMAGPTFVDIDRRPMGPVPVCRMGSIRIIIGTTHKEQSRQQQKKKPGFFHNSILPQYLPVTGGAGLG